MKLQMALDDHEVYNEGYMKVTIKSEFIDSTINEKNIKILNFPNCFRPLRHLLPVLGVENFLAFSMYTETKFH